MKELVPRGHVGSKLRSTVIARAENRCEYCRFSQVGQEATFHIDHILPVSRGGTDDSENIALACVSCSLRKASRTKTIDPEFGNDVPLFNPRRQNWHDHFQIDGAQIVGRSAIGRGTVDALQMNRPLAVAIREEETRRNRFH